ncbi:hypothetical protein ACN9MB_01260 [Dyella kyungheensis]|uniref:hypothetical protein n=1 Tax=Dyella kyungheensis TaxID=1242174 RepID=UPI003CF41FD1
MNPIFSTIRIGTIGELLVQLRLLEHGVQAAPPLKDSGNDLIAVNGVEFRSVSVKTTETGTYEKPADRLYHVLAVVKLVTENGVALDRSSIWLMTPEDVQAASPSCTRLKEEHLMSRARVEDLFGPVRAESGRALLPGWVV